MTGRSRLTGRYTDVAIALHWVTAAAFAFQIGLGWRLTGQDRAGFAAFQLHKSIGITILLLTVLRLGWRLAHPAPSLPTGLSSIERGLARWAHRCFYLLLLVLPLTGWALVSTSSRRVPTVLYGLLPWPNLPIARSVEHGANAAAGVAHHWLAWIAFALIALHVAGALKHQLYDRDREYARMAPLPVRLLSPASIGAVIGAAALMVWGRSGGADAAPAPTRTASNASLASEPPAPPRPTDLPKPLIEPAPIPTASPTPSVTIIPSTWSVSKRSTIRFSSAFSGGPIEGGFSRWTADISFDPAALDASAVTVVVDLASVTAAAAEQQSALPGEEWLAAALHPQAVFHATRFRATGKNRYLATGTLTLRGVRRPLALPFTLGIDGDHAIMTGEVAIDRTAFGIGQGEWASTADLPAAVKVAVALQADRKRPPIQARLSRRFRPAPA